VQAVVISNHKQTRFLNTLRRYSDYPSTNFAYPIIRDLNTLFQMSALYHRISEEDHLGTSMHSSVDTKDEDIPGDRPGQQKSSRKLLSLCSYVLVCVLSICVGLMIHSALKSHHSIESYQGKFSAELFLVLYFHLNTMVPMFQSSILRRLCEMSLS
jgi:hypothetical protein